MIHLEVENSAWLLPFDILYALYSQEQCRLSSQSSVSLSLGRRFRDLPEWPRSFKTWNWLSLKKTTALTRRRGSLADLVCITLRQRCRRSTTGCNMHATASSGTHDSAGTCQSRTLKIHGSGECRFGFALRRGEKGEKIYDLIPTFLVLFEISLRYIIENMMYICICVLWSSSYLCNI